MFKTFENCGPNNIFIARIKGKINNKPNYATCTKPCELVSYSWM